jgi:predicted nucleic acid-binding protein
LSAVVDSSVLVAALVDSGLTMTWAEQVLAGGNLCAPELAKVEAMNIIYRLERAKQIATVEANLDVHALSQLEIERFAFEPSARWVWELRHAVTCYDAWYVGRRRSCGLAARNAGPSSVPRPTALPATSSCPGDQAIAPGRLEAHSAQLRPALPTRLPLTKPSPPQRAFFRTPATRQQYQVDSDPRRATNIYMSQGIPHPSLKARSVTHVSDTSCHLCRVAYHVPRLAR